MKKAKILIIDDEVNTRVGLREALEDDYDVTVAEDGLRGLAWLREHQTDIVLTDLRMPGLDGMAFTREVSSWPDAPLIIMLTAYGSVQTAVQALKEGAYDYLSKPVDLDSLDTMLQKGLDVLAQRRGEAQATGEAAEMVLPGVVGRSAVMREVMSQVRRVAAARTTVLVTGESGTGKELVAQAIHSLSPRADGPFVAVHCAALSESLQEAELFGHEKGAFTGAVERVIGRFELAHGGTLFLDEIGEISPATQVKLLRVLETQRFERVGGSKTISVDVRVVAATNRDLKAMSEAGTFREDLYYRLNVINIGLPPLRQRREDIPAIIDYYLKKCAADNGRPVMHCGGDALQMLSAYDWPGNVRELRNCVERMVVFAQGSTLTINDVPEQVRAALDEQFGQANEPEAEPAETREASAGLDIHAHEKALIMKALEECNGNCTAAAEKLKIARRTLYRKLEKYGIGKNDRLEGMSRPS